jgi:predicted CopG family antitoxin
MGPPIYAMVKHTILVRDETRERLKEIGKKGQSYDELINQLLKSKNSNSIYRTDISDRE